MFGPGELEGVHGGGERRADGGGGGGSHFAGVVWWWFFSVGGRLVRLQGVRVGL